MTGWSSARAVAGELLRRFTAALGTDPAVDLAGRDLLDRYAEPHRAYHDQRHLLEVLTRLELLCDPVPVEVVCAAFWHDAVYDGAADAEARSAALAEASLRALRRPPDLVDEVARLVRLTATHAPAPGDRTGALLCDADLGVLAAPAPRYADYVAGVRAEHASLDDAAFRAGRAAVLRALVGRPRLFSTQAGHRLWEQDARRNVAAELAALSAGGTPVEGDAAPPR